MQRERGVGWILHLPKLVLYAGQIFGIVNMGINGNAFGLSDAVKNEIAAEQHVVAEFVALSCVTTVGELPHQATETTTGHQHFHLVLFLCIGFG